VPLPNVLLQSEHMTRRDDRVSRRNTPVDARAHFVVHLLRKYLCSMNAGNALIALACMNISCQSARDAITVADRRTWMLRIAVRDAKSESPSREASQDRLSRRVPRQLWGPRTRGEVALDDWALKAFFEEHQDAGGARVDRE
jgi:hypothetical protein